MVKAGHHKEKTLEEAVHEDPVAKYHPLTQTLKDIPRDDASTSLQSELHRFVSEYFHANKDEKTGNLTFESDEQKRDFAFRVWDMAAEHIAKKYLGMDAEKIAELKNTKTKDDASQWEEFMKAHMGNMDKEAFFDELASLSEMTPENIANYTTPIYRGHISSRSNTHIRKHLKSLPDAQGLIEYLKAVKRHNPVTFKGISIPEKITSIEQVAQFYTQILPQIPENYDPANPATYQKPKAHHAHEAGEHKAGQHYRKAA